MRKMRKKIILLVFFSLAAEIFGQQFNFDFDYARFRLNDTLSFVEFYYSFPQDEMEAQTNDKNENYVEGSLIIEIKDAASEQIVFNREFRVLNKISSESIGKKFNLIGLIRISISPGKYKVKVTGSDYHNPASKRVINENITIDKSSNDKLYFSDIQLASSIKQESSNSTSLFYKNTLEVSPNPNAVFGVGAPVAFYYLELYNLDKRNDIQAPVEIRTTLLNSRGEQIYDKKKVIRNDNPAIVEVGAINILKYPSDIYLLVVSAKDSVNKISTHSAKKLYVYNPEVKDTIRISKIQKEAASAEFSVMTEEECQDMLIKTKYIMSAAQVSQYNSLTTLEAKREYWFNFWKRLDPDPSTAINEYKEQYMRRVDLSNERFSTINKRGMFTDRGRVFIIYGEPDEIDRYPNELDKKPYEIWYYNSIEGGVIFVFGDVTGFSNYELLHSTKRGELRDDNWMRRIQQQ